MTSKEHLRLRELSRQVYTYAGKMNLSACQLKDDAASVVTRRYFVQLEKRMEKLREFLRTIG